MLVYFPKAYFYQLTGGGVHPLVFVEILSACEWDAYPLPSNAT